MKKYSHTDIKNFLEKINTEYARLHKNYETNFWKSYMGEPQYDSKMNIAMGKRDAFRSNTKLADTVDIMLDSASEKHRKRLYHWQRFFSLHQTPAAAIEIRTKIADIENDIAQKKNFEKEGYIDPISKTFKKMSKTQMKTAMQTEPNERIRKAYFKALEKLVPTVVPEYVQLVKLRNTYAQLLGYDDFYAYKSENEDNLSKDELFGIFEDIYSKTKYAFSSIRKLEKMKKNLRKPWNFAYMMSGDFIAQEDQYFQLGSALEYWGRAFQNMGIDMDGGTLQLDLIARVGKYNNGFCHWPQLVSFSGVKKIPGRSNFTCNAIIGQIGSGNIAMNTLFHEGGHAAHLLNSQQSDVCINHEYLPMTSAWAETQSMFFDCVFSSIEWKTRYAKNSAGEFYPLELYKNKLAKLQPLRPLSMMGINAVMSFERDIYEEKNLTKTKVLEYAKKNFKKYFDPSEDSLWLLAVPHIYSFESACSYHGYGLAQLAVSQWREYFYKKYGHIVDNKNIGKEMKKVWALGAGKTFPEFVKIATEKKLSPVSFIKGITNSEKQTMTMAKKRIVVMEKVRKNDSAINLKADITMVHGKKKISTNKKSFDDMVEKYGKWINSQK